MDNDTLSMPSDAVIPQTVCAQEPSQIAQTAIVEPVDHAKAMVARFGDKVKPFSSETARAAILKRWEAQRLSAPTTSHQSVPTVKGDTIAPYIKEQLKIVRARMKQVNEMMIAETDAGKMDRLASAWSKLAEQERILDGRPLPGSLKPTTAKPRDRRMDSINPVG